MASIRTGFAGQLAELHSLVQEMGAFVSQMLDDSIQALLTQDASLAEDVRERDNVADELDERIETLATRLLALQQPMAGDLRAITASLKIVTDLERIADYAVAIARVAASLAGEPYFKPLEDTTRMADLVKEIVRQSLEAFDRNDVAFAKQVRDSDKAIDQLWNKLEAELIDWMKREPRVVEQATRLVLVARYFERIGDHAKNITERVAFRETGHRKPSRFKEAANGGGAA